MKNRTLYKVLSLMLSSVFVLCCAFSVHADEATVTEDISVSPSVTGKKTAKTVDYNLYSENSLASDGSQKIYLLTDKNVVSGKKIVKRDNAVFNELSVDNRSVTYLANIDKPGAYNIEIEYLALEGKMKNIVFSLYINGALPFSEAASISLSRVFKDAGKITADVSGNDMRPSQVEVSRVISARLSNSDGYYDDPYKFVFDKAGEYRLTFKYAEEDMLISKVSIGIRLPIPCL